MTKPIKMICDILTKNVAKNKTNIKYSYAL